MKKEQTLKEEIEEWKRQLSYMPKGSNAYTNAYEGLIRDKAELKGYQEGKQEAQKELIFKLEAQKKNYENIEKEAYTQAKQEVLNKIFNEYNKRTLADNNDRQKFIQFMENFKGELEK